MAFNSGLHIGDKVTNEKMRTVFRCGNMGGMRRSKKTGTLVIISDNTKGLYQDIWKDGVLHYTGMGKKGDQVLKGNQNKTLYDSNENGVEVHLFEVEKKREYIYRGVVRLEGEPYKATQLDELGNNRDVWIFPVKPVDEDSEEELLEKEIIVLTDEELAKRSSDRKVNIESKTTQTVVYNRDPYLKEMVKRFAKGKCQLCHKEAPFNDKNGRPYLEEHHVKKLADGGSDTIDNVVAICPNCHRKIHILNSKKDVAILEKIADQNKKRCVRALAYRQGMEESGFIKEKNVENNR